MAILEYGRFFDCDDEELHDLLFFVRRLDSVYLKHVSRKSKVKGKSGKGNGKS